MKLGILRTMPPPARLRLPPLRPPAPWPARTLDALAGAAWTALRLILSLAILAVIAVATAAVLHHLAELAERNPIP